MSKKKKSLIFNIILVILGIIGFIISIKNVHLSLFVYYTQDSNIFAFIISGIYVYYLLKEKEIPVWLNILKYIAVTSLMVTFLVVIFILAPMFGFNYVYFLFVGANLYYHFLCPIIAFISFVFFEEYEIKGYKENLLATSFTGIYAFIFIILNILKIVDGPYPFLQIYKNPIYMSVLWFFLIVGGSFFLSKSIEKIKRKSKKNLHKI